MTFDWYQYLVLAEYLYDNRDTFPDREACLRAAISRAYYAAFSPAHNFAESLDRLDLYGSGKDHGLVRNHYMNSRDTKKRKVGILLGRLRDFRNEADYSDTIENAEDLAKISISQSTEVHK